MLLVTVSVAVIRSVPAWVKVAVKLPVPLVSVLLAGRLPRPSIVLKWIVPE
jgi:hypothetical protein